MNWFGNRESGGYSSCRESGIEGLRLICILGIIVMHTFGSYRAAARGLNLALGVLINSIFNMGVSIFGLISGYFEVKESYKKVINLWLWCLFYSVLSTVIYSIGLRQINYKDIIKSLLPISSGKYWYITAYIIIIFFSRFLNLAPRKLSKKDFGYLICLMFFLFAVIPTFCYFHVMNDGGKGLMNMILMYYIGRYIRLYGINEKRTIVIGAASIAIEFLLNLMMTFFILKDHGVIALFARDCSIFIIFGSIAVFLLAKNKKFHSNKINRTSAHIFAVYLFEGAFRALLECFINLTEYVSYWYFCLVIFTYSIVVLVGCIVVDIVCRNILTKPLERVESFIEKKIKKLLDVYVI